MAKKPFGDWLQQEGILTEEQIGEGHRSRSVYGGRLGTNLVEIGYLSLDELSELLVRYYGLPLAPTPWLESPDPKAIQLVPMPLIRRLKVLPLHLDRDAVHVAMLDPHDPEQLDFLVAATSRQVMPYVLPELRLLYWLETHLQIDRHPRFVNLAARLRRTDMTLPAEAETGDVVAAHESPAQPEHEICTPDQAPSLLDQWFEDDVLRPEEEEPESPADAADDEVEELLLEELAVEPEPSAGLSGPAVSGPVTATRVAELEAQLLAGADRDAIALGVLELARVYCEVAVLFVVHGGTVRPLRASGGDVCDRLEGVEVPLGVHSIFSHPAVTGFAFRGAPPEGGIDARLLEAIDRADAHDLLVQPIRIRDRVVNLLYCDNGSSAFGETSIAALGAVADCGSRAYERLILERKRGAEGSAT